MAFLYFKDKVKYLKPDKLISLIVTQKMKFFVLIYEKIWTMPFVNKGVALFNGNFEFQGKFIQYGVRPAFWILFSQISTLCLVWPTNKNSVIGINYCTRLILLVLTNNFLWYYWWCLDCSFLRLLQFSDLS